MKSRNEISTEDVLLPTQTWHAEAHTRVAALAALFHSRGVRKGDRVAIRARNYRS
ncbi:BQ5605_C002g01543 [Microbotryum silenes-dioicae]|uniref:BQ5605_C002g01543 protein n=1 Tax=Microbotryum silenes-dioicae TaxID=796604 RepID=A0A2X0LZ32_9BASI|nr:BQ5605_C002g01543 [Microbotryum silenes-dioicae]